MYVCMRVRACMCERHVGSGENRLVIQEAAVIAYLTSPVKLQLQSISFQSPVSIQMEIGDKVI